ncbi:MAG: GGDEF domain-containing protein [Lachnospiraceae bacterium]|nr:GGDEF domain-containing protein [Lachnospiraceae bacterium]
MKKKLAVFANGFSIDSLLNALKGIRQFAAEKDFDIFVFMSFASYSENRFLNQGELNIYNLPLLEDFDGVIVFSNHLNSNETAVSLCKKAREQKIPVVSIGMPIEDIPSVCISNETGMRELVTHLIEEHGVKRIVFLAGTPDHVDSNARLETTKAVLKEHGLELKEEDIRYGDWGNTLARELVQEFVKKKEFPDALVCANDIMALAAATEFNHFGYMVPDDMIITGFDNTAYGRNYYPAISTVDQNYKEIGYNSCKLIYEQIEGDTSPKKIMIPSIFSHAESCGCKDLPWCVEMRLDYCRHSYQKHMDSSALEMYERILRSRIADMTDYEALKKEMQVHYSRNNHFEGKEFYLVINPEYFEDAVAREEELFINGYKEQLEVIVAFKDGAIQPYTKTTRREIVPHYEKIEGEQHVYYIMPLHYFQYNYGYMILKDEPPIILLDMLNPYLEKLQQSLKLLRINLRLDALNKDLTRIYNRDPMTGLFNRLAYEEMAVTLYEKCMQNKQPMMVMFVDINYMKRINDRYGHLHGDNAIKTVAGSIKYVLKKDWIGVRFGGDEFLIIGSNCNEEGAIAVRHSILAFLELKNNDGSQPYEISASCGYVITDPETPGNLQDYVKEADNIMYKIKQEVHARDGISRY